MKQYGILIAVLGVYLAITLPRAASPLTHHDEYALMEWGRHARSLARFGFVHLGFAPVSVDGPDLGADPDWRRNYYVSRPVFPCLVLGMVFAIFGSGEFQMRATLIVAGLASIVAFYALAGALGGRSWAQVATPLFFTAPIFLYFSNVAYHLTFALPFILLAIYGYWRWYAGGRKVWLCVVAAFAACQCDWPGYFAVALLALHAWRNRPHARRACLFALLGALVTFAFHLVHMGLLEPAKMTHLRSIVQMIRTYTVGNEIVPWNLKAWIASQTIQIGRYFSVGLVVLAAVGSLFAFRERTTADRFLPYLFLLALDEVLFLPFAIGHDFLTFMLLPGLALLACRGAVALWSRPAWGRAVCAVLVLLCIAQSGITSASLLYRDVPDESLIHAMGSAIERETHPKDRLLTLIWVAPSSVGYYGDRYLTFYYRSRGILLSSHGDIIQGHIDDAALIRLLRTNELGISVVVTVVGEALARDVPAMQMPDPEEWRRFVERHQIDTGSGPIVAALEEIAVEKWSSGGFRFFRLKQG